MIKVRALSLLIPFQAVHKVFTELDVRLQEKDLSSSQMIREPPTSLLYGQELGPGLMVITSAICLYCLPLALGSHRFLWISAGGQLPFWDNHFQEIRKSMEQINLYLSIASLDHKEHIVQVKNVKSGCRVARQWLAKEWWGQGCHLQLLPLVRKI